MSPYRDTVSPYLGDTHLLPIPNLDVFSASIAQLDAQPRLEQWTRERCTLPMDTLHTGNRCTGMWRCCGNTRRTILREGLCVCVCASNHFCTVILKSRPMITLHVSSILGLLKNFLWYLGIRTRTHAHTTSQRTGLARVCRPSGITGTERNDVHASCLRAGICQYSLRFAVMRTRHHGERQLRTRVHTTHSVSTQPRWPAMATRGDALCRQA